MLICNVLIIKTKEEVMNLKYFTLLTATVSAFFVSSAIAAETINESEAVKVQKPSELRLNVRRIGLELSSTEVSNSEEYENSPVSQLNTDSQSVIKGILDVVLEYDHEKMRWDNSIFLNYGKTKIKPRNEFAETTENEDKILLTSDYTYKLLKIHNMDLGPFASIEYQTEFTRNEDAPRMKVFRGKTGAKLLNGKIIKNLYIAGVGEYDMTYSDNKTTKFALETGWRLEHTVRDGVKLSTDGYFRKYLSYSNYVGTDLKYDLSLTARMDVDMTNNLTFGPYISYRQAQAREAHKKGSNLMLGVSLAYKDLFQLWQ